MNLSSMKCFSMKPYHAGSYQFYSALIFIFSTHRDLKVVKISVKILQCIQPSNLEILVIFIDLLYSYLVNQYLAQFTAQCLSG